MHIHVFCVSQNGDHWCFHGKFNYYCLICKGFCLYEIKGLTRKITIRMHCVSSVSRIKEFCRELVTISQQFEFGPASWYALGKNERPTSAQKGQYLDNRISVKRRHLYGLLRHKRVASLVRVYYL